MISHERLSPGLMYGLKQAADYQTWSCESVPSMPTDSRILGPRWIQLELYDTTPCSTHDRLTAGDVPDLPTGSKPGTKPIIELSRERAPIQKSYKSQQYLDRLAKLSLYAYRLCQSLAAHTPCSNDPNAATRMKSKRMHSPYQMKYVVKVSDIAVGLSFDGRRSRIAKLRRNRRSRCDSRETLIVSLSRPRARISSTSVSSDGWLSHSRTRSTAIWSRIEHRSIYLTA